MQWPFALVTDSGAVVVVEKPDAVGVAVSAVSGNTCGASGLCVQTWELALDVLAALPTCNFDGTHRLRFSLRCRVAGSECPLDANTNTAELTLQLRSSSHCASVVDSIGLEPTLASFETLSPTRVTKRDFLVEQTARFAVAVRASKASILSSRVERVVADGKVVYDRTASPQAPLAAVDFSVLSSGGNAVPNAFSESTFQFVVAASEFAVAADSARSLSISCQISVLYAFDAGGAPREELLDVVLQKARAREQPVYVRGDILVQRLGGGSVGSPASTSPSSSFFGSAASLAVGGALLISFLLLVAIAVAVVARRRRRRRRREAAACPTREGEPVAGTELARHSLAAVPSSSLSNLGSLATDSTEGEAPLNEGEATPSGVIADLRAVQSAYESVTAARGCGEV